MWYLPRDRTTVSKATIGEAEQNWEPKNAGRIVKLKSSIASKEGDAYVLAGDGGKRWPA